MFRRSAAFVVIPLLLASLNAQAQSGEEAKGGQDTAATDLAKATQNPVADLIAFPLQFNFNSGGDLGSSSSFLLNFQPVIPLALNDHWNIVWRNIVPIFNMPVSDGSRDTGMGDIQSQMFFAPSKPGKIIWGFGPVFSFPTATANALTTGQWGLGLTAVVVKMAGPFVLGMLANNIWRIAGINQGPDLNQFTVQPFVNYNFKKGWSLAFSPLITANWSAASDDQWTVPLGLGVSKVQIIGEQPVSLTLQYYRNVLYPTGTGANQVRMVFSFLFPVKSDKKK